MPITIRLAQPRDATDIAALSRKAVEHGLPWGWTSARVAKAISDPNVNVVVARLAGSMIGFGVMEYSDASAHLLLFAIDEPDRRRGLGSQLLEWLEAVALAAGITDIRLEARADNVAALAFYRKHGYQEYSTELGMYYGAEDGVRLVKTLGASVNPTSSRVKPSAA